MACCFGSVSCCHSMDGYCGYVGCLLIWVIVVWDTVIVQTAKYCVDCDASVIAMVVRTILL